MRGAGNTEILPEKSTNVCCIFIEQLEIETAASIMEAAVLFRVMLGQNVVILKSSMRVVQMG